MLPASLKAGDTIAIAATARKVSLAEIQPAISIFEQWGLKVKLSSSLFNEQYQLAGNDSARAKSFQELLDDDSIKAIICARGGYGTVRMIDKLDFSHFSKSPKWIIGYSDITVLHSHIFATTNIATLHATMPINMQAHNANSESIESLKKILFGEYPSYSIPVNPLNKFGNAQGKLVGGNLSVLYSLIGSPSDIDTTNCILFLEDLDEYLYHVDRMIMNLKRAGKLQHLAGLVIGGMSDMKDNTIPFGKTVDEIIAEHTIEFNFPIVYGFAAGHEPKNLALVMGEAYALHSSAHAVELKQVLS